MTTAKIEWLLPSVPESLLMLDDPPQGLRPKWLSPGAYGDVLQINSAGQLVWGPVPGTGDLNPMTTPGDMIYGLAAGFPARVGIGASGDILTVVSGVPTWTPLASPIVAPGDLIVGNPSGSPARLPVGAAGKVLTVVTGMPTWSDPAASGLTNPMTTVGDLIKGGVAGAPARLPAALDGQVLTLVGGTPQWVTTSDTRYGNWEWKAPYAATMPDGKVAIDDSSTPTLCAISTKSNDGIDTTTTILASVRAGDLVYIQDKADATKFYNLNILADPTFSGTTCTFSVSLHGTQGTPIANTRPVRVVFTLFSGGSGAGAGMANPMTALGDLIRGGTAGAPTRLAAGTNGQWLTLAAGIPSWSTLPVDPGFANPLTTLGDVLVAAAAGAPSRLGIGTAAQVLTVASGVPAWAAPTVAGSGPATPPTVGAVSTVGDNGTNTPTTVSHTTGAGQTYMLVKVGMNGVTLGTVSTVTFGATSLTKLISANGFRNRCELWGGTVPAGTTATVTVTYASSFANACVAVTSYSGVSSVGTPKANVATGGGAVSSTLTMDEVGAHILATDAIETDRADTDPTIGAGQTTEFTRFADPDFIVELDGSKKLNAATMGWTGLTHGNGDACHVAVPLIGALAPGGISFPILAPDGSLAAPSYSFLSDPASGFYRGMAGGTSFAGHLFPGSDGLLDVGALSRRLRSLYALTSVAVGGGTGYITLDHQDAAVARIRSDKVILITQDGMGLQGLKLNWGTVQSHYNLVLGTETYPDTGTGILFLSEPVSAITTTATGLVALYGQDYAAAGTKGLTIRTEDGFIHRIGKGHQYPALSALPATPPAGFVVVYAKSSDKKVYQKDDAGLETILTANNPMTAVGDLIIGSTAGAPARLAAVATGAVLASAGVTTAPTWSTAPTLASLTLTARLILPRVTVTYSASMTPDASLGNVFVITASNATAFTINAPTNPVTGQEITFVIRNTSGGTLGTVTWNAVFKKGTFTSPASANSRAISFLYDGTNWVETVKSAADVPN